MNHDFVCTKHLFSVLFGKIKNVKKILWDIMPICTLTIVKEKKPVEYDISTDL